MQAPTQEASEHQLSKHSCKPQPNSSLSLITEFKKKKKKKMKKSIDKNNHSSSNAKQQQEEEKKKSTDKKNCDEEDSVTKKSTQNYTTEEEEEEEDDEKNNKSEKQPFERIWSEKDEITILEGLADFTSSTTEKGREIRIMKFFNEKKDALQLDASYTQVRHKVTKLRVKYKKNVEKLNNGVNRSSVFSKPHELKLFCLSQKIWGNRDDDKNIVEPHLGGSCLVYNYNDVVKRGIEMIEKSRNQVLKQKLEKLQVEEMKLILMRSKINKELSLLIMEANNEFTAN